MTEPSTKQPSGGRFAREVTSFIAAPFIIFVVGWGADWAYIGMIAFAAIFALYEFLTLGERKGYPVNKTLSILLMVLLLSAFIVKSISVEIGVFATLLLIPAMYVFSRIDLEKALPATAVCVLSILYVGMLTGALLRLRLDFPYPVGAKLVFFLFLVVWLGDAGAYYVGKKFGKRRLSPRISPKKSVEGLFGGIAASLITALVIRFTFFDEFPVIHAIIAAVILSVSGVVGDLAESMWKRSADVKDSGTLIPGHGGFLDRTDSILFTAPILYAYWFLLQHDFHLGS